MTITELPPFTPKLEEYRAEEFLAHTLTLLEYPIEQDQTALDMAPFQVKAPPPPPEPRIPLLPPIWYPKPTAEVIATATRLTQAPRLSEWMGGGSGEAAAERVMRPLLAGHGPTRLLGESGIGKTALLGYIAHHERTRQRFRRIWYFDEPERVGQLAAILLNLSNVLAETDPYMQLSLLAPALADDTLLIVDNLTPGHPLLSSLLGLSRFVLVGIETQPEIFDEDAEGLPIIPPEAPNEIRLRRPDEEEALHLLASLAHLLDRKNTIPREIRPTLAALVAEADYHPLAIRMLAALMREDELSPEALLNELAALTMPSGVLKAAALCVRVLSAEEKKVLDAFAAFTPLGANLEGLSAVLSSANVLALGRSLTVLKRHSLIVQDHRFAENYILAAPLYQQMDAAGNPYEPGQVAGERAQNWLAGLVDAAAYAPEAMFEAEIHIRHAYRVAERYKLHTFSARLNPMLNDYLRTYIPGVLPHDAPPPRLIGERAQAIQLARHGLEMAESGEIEQGREIIQTAITQLEIHGSPHDLAGALVILAVSYEASGHYNHAIAPLERAARLVYDLGAVGSVSVVRHGLAIAYRHIGRLKEALAVLDDGPEAEAERARIYRALGDTANMMRALGASNDLTPYARAESYLQAGYYVEALSAIADDHSAASHLLRAMIYHLQGEYEAALRGYQQALNSYPSYDPERAIPARAMAAIYALQGQYDTAENLLTTTLGGLENGVQNGLTQGLLSALHLQQGNNRTAVEVASQALQKLLPEGAPHDEIADVYRTLGRACWRLERYPDALNAFLQETEHAQSGPERDEARVAIALFHTAEAYRLTDQRERAVPTHRRALTHIKPDEHPHIYFMIQSALFRVLSEMERYADALTVNEEAIAHLSHRPPPDLGFLGYLLARNVREYQRVGKHPQAFKSFSRWLSTLAGRADALTEPERPALAVLALTLASRSLIALGRAPEAVPLAHEALRLAETCLRQPEWAAVSWAARRDYGEALLGAGQFGAVYEVLSPLLVETVKADSHTYAAAQEGAGVAWHELGEYRRALEHFWAALDHQPIPYRQSLLFERAAHSYLALGDTAGAVENFHEAMKLLERNAFPGDAARILTTLAHTLAGVNRYADAIGVYEEALHMLQAVPDASPLYTAQVYTSLGRSNEIQGQLKQASEAYRHALDIHEKHTLNAPHEYRSLLLNLARVLVGMSSYQEAIPYFESARDQAADWGTPQEVGNITRELAEAERDGDYLSRCLRTYEDGLELLPAADYPADRAAMLRSYGQALAMTQQFEEARKAWSEALTITEGLSPLEIALTHHAIGQAHRAQRNPAEAESAFRQALAYHPAGTVDVAATYRELGETLLETNRAADSLSPLQSALEIERALPQQSNARLVKTLQLLGIATEQSGDRSAAIRHYHSALVYMDRTFQPQLYAATLRTLGRLYAEGGLWENCQKALGDALEIEAAIKPRADERIAQTLRMIADAYRAEGHLEKAATAYKKMASYANLSNEDAGKLRATLDDIDRFRATLDAARDSLAGLERTGAETKDFVFVYALIVWMHYLLSEMEQSRAVMEKIVRLLNEAEFDPEDERADYRSLANLRLAFQHEKQKDKARARDYYRLALKDNSDRAIQWLIEQSMQAVM